MSRFSNEFHFNGYNLIPGVYSIEGNIGTGKSTLLEILKKRYQNVPNIVFIDEPVKEWDEIKDLEGNTMLQKFYGNQEKYSFAFQMMALISRIKKLKDAINKNPNSVIISERSVYTDKYVFAQMLYDTKKIEEVEFQIYMKWFDSFTKECKIEKVIYVKTSPEICHERISKRSRIGEEVIPLKYLQDCNYYHDKMISNSDFCRNVLEINGNIDLFLEDIEKLENNLFTKIDFFIVRKHHFYNDNDYYKNENCENENCENENCENENCENEYSWIDTILSSKHLNKYLDSFREFENSKLNELSYYDSDNCDSSQDVN
jgi:deoxyadenosine/deoxycytidine kinase